MYKIFLINPPFAGLEYPSLALTQLKYRLDEQFGDRVSMEICYLNQEFARYLDPNLYREIAHGEQHFEVGLGEWFFRQAAFPSLPDNSEEYFQRFYASSDERTLRFRKTILEKRQGLERFIDELIVKYHLDQAQLVGFTSLFYQNASCFAMARKLKELGADIVTVMGGANCETPMGEEIVKNIRDVDFVFSGPALISFPQFVGYRLERDFEPCHRIRGVFSRSNCLPEGQPAMSGPHIGPGTISEDLDINTPIELNYRPFLQGLKSLFPNREVWPALLFETSRGCWWGERSHCTFCGINGLSMNYRAMNPQNAIALLNSLFAYAGECSQLHCVDNILPKNYPKDVFALLDTPPSISLFYEVKVDLSEEDVQHLAHARVTSMQPGIESLATSTLKLMKKGTTSFLNLRLLKYFVTYDVVPIWNLLIGYPGETVEVYQKYLRDFPLLTHLPPPIFTCRLRFDRYSPHSFQPEKYGLDLRPHDFYPMVYPFSRASLANFATFFVDSNEHADYIANYLAWGDKIKEATAQWRRTWWTSERSLWTRQFPDRPKLMFKQHGNETFIYDSRAGEGVEYPLRESNKQLLSALEQPLRKAELAKQFSHLDIEQEIAFLQERRLLFEENERFMSLVLPDKSANNSTTASQTQKQSQPGGNKRRELAVVSFSQETVAK